MKHILTILFIILSFSAFSQTKFPSVDSAKNYVLRYVKNSAVESFTNWRMQNVSYGTLELLDSLAGSGEIDSIWKTGDTLKYSKLGVNYTIGTVVGSIHTLQQVTTAGNSTTDSINIKTPLNKLAVSVTSTDFAGAENTSGEIKLRNTFDNSYLYVNELGLSSYSSGSALAKDLRFRSNRNQYSQIFLPDSSGTLTQRIKANGTIYNTENNGLVDLGTISTDTTSLSNRINLRVRYTDTSAMLTPYLHKIDTTNAFLISVSQPNDSTLRFAKGATQTDYIIRSAVAGSATRLTTTVYNNSGSTILKGAVVYINGRHSSNLPTIALAQANNEANSYTTFALVETDISNGSSGIVIQVGNIGNLNLPTSTYSDGQVLYLSPTVPGGYTTTKPLAPQHITKLGTVTRAHPTQGSIQIKIENGWQLDELSDVQIAAVPNDSTILQFSRIDSLWKAVDPTTAMGNRFVKRTDSAAMLSPYLRSNVAAATYQLILDTVPLAVFGAGSGAAGDTAAFSTSAVYGSFYNAGSDTLIITQMRAGVLGTSPSITTEVYWNDSLNVIGGGATLLVTSGTSVTGTIGATNVTSFTNNKIPPNVWVFVRTSAVATKPTYFTLTLLGYKKRI